MPAVWPVRNRLRLVASAALLAGAIVLVVATEWGSLAGRLTAVAPGHGRAAPADAQAATRRPAAPDQPSAIPGITGGPTPVRAFGVAPIPPPPPEGPRSPIADRLHDADRPAAGDVAIVEELVATYVQAFHRVPLGTNAEITAALAGDNPRGLAPLPADHPAISAAGELLDRWGTPFFFHQVDRVRLEVRSAGPDRRLFTADDVGAQPLSRAGALEPPAAVLTEAN